MREEPMAVGFAHEVCAPSPFSNLCDGTDQGIKNLRVKKQASKDTLKPAGHDGVRSLLPRLIGPPLLRGQERHLVERPSFTALIGCERTLHAVEPLAAANVGQTTERHNHGRNIIN